MNASAAEELTHLKLIYLIGASISNFVTRSGKRMYHLFPTIGRKLGPALCTTDELF
jgi:hypothetical protein